MPGGKVEGSPRTNKKMSVWGVKALRAVLSLKKKSKWRENI